MELNRLGVVLLHALDISQTKEGVHMVWIQQKDFLKEGDGIPTPFGQEGVNTLCVEFLDLLFPFLLTCELPIKKDVLGLFNPNTEHHDQSPEGHGEKNKGDGRDLNGYLWGKVEGHTSLIEKGEVADNTHEQDKKDD
jgi:hypothetical protein